MNRQQLRQEVFELERFTPELKERFERQIRNIVEKPLKPWERALAMALVPFGLLFGAFCALVLFIRRDVFSTLIRTEVVLAALLGVLMAGWALRVLKTGRHLKNELLVPCVAFGVFVAMIVVSIIMTGSVDVDLLAATMLIGFLFVWERVNIAELRLREHMLRQELRLAELAEHFPGPGDEGSPRNEAC